MVTSRLDDPGAAYRRSSWKISSITWSPAGDGGAFFQCTRTCRDNPSAASAISRITAAAPGKSALWFFSYRHRAGAQLGAVADSRGTLPHDGAVDRDCELARHVRFDCSHHR